MALKLSPKGLSPLEPSPSASNQLSGIAADLNAVSDELGACVNELDQSLKTLNLGITVWIQIRGDESDEDNTFWCERIGYSKVAGKWGVALQTAEGDSTLPERANHQTWLFNDAPRSLRLGAIEKIPELIETLSAEAAKATKEINEKLAAAKAVAAAVKAAADGRKKSPFDLPSVKPDLEQKK